jgi:phage terminase small subunit
METAREIRLVEREFGLTPLSRRRLEWTVAETEERKDKHELNRSKRSRIVSGDDPRTILGD